MFGKNVVVGKKYFAEAGESLFVTSVFYTLQGEGPYSGRPAVFVRLAKCNLDCSMCDTFFDDGEFLTPQQLNSKIYESICSFWNERGLSVPRWALPEVVIEFGSVGSYPNIGLIITGGEPLLQQAAVEFMNRSSEWNQFAFIQVETNGTQDTSELDEDVCIVCSPKCLEKDGKPIRYLKPNLQVLETADCLKFVLSSDPDSPYHTVPEWAFEWQRTTGSDVYVSPMNIYNRLPQVVKMHYGGAKDIETRSTKDEVVSFWKEGLLNREVNKANHEYAARYAMLTGCMLSLQTHLYASLP